MTPRRKYLVHHHFQMDFTIKAFIAIFVPVLVCLIFFVIMVMQATAASPSSVNYIADSRFWWLFLLRALPIAFAVFVFSIFFSHRIAGPIRKMQNLCDQLGQGINPPPIVLRKKDYFQDFAGKLNRIFHARSPK